MRWNNAAHLPITDLESRLGCSVVVYRDKAKLQNLILLSNHFQEKTSCFFKRVKRLLHK